jgi:hypothetical protein
LEQTLEIHLFVLHTELALLLIHANVLPLTLDLNVNLAFVMENLQMMLLFVHLMELALHQILVNVQKDTLVQLVM